MSHETNIELQWYFSYGQRACKRRAIGGMLSRSETYAFDSQGKRIPAEYDSWNTIYVHKDHKPPPLDNLDLDEMVRFAKVSRRLMRVGEKSPRALAILEAYCGDEGSRWADEKPKRLFALYPLTETGRREVLKSRSSQPFLHLSNLDRLATLYQAEQVQSRPERKKALENMLHEAVLLIEAAYQHWLDSDESKQRSTEVTHVLPTATHHHRAQCG